MLSGFFSSKPLLVVCVDDKQVATVQKKDPPCDLSVSALITKESELALLAAGQPARIHRFAYEEGWAHLSVRVSAGLACQVDCMVTKSPTFDPTALQAGDGTGIRFQPYLLQGARDDNTIFVGRSAFFRGLHYSGTITPGNVSLACICDHCGKDFRLQSFHAGFSGVGYFYSSSGRYTLIVSEQMPGAPPALGKPDLAALAELEPRLPKAPDGSSFSYKNSLRCPHCDTAFIDFEKYPEQRENEYYGNTFFGELPIRFEDESSLARAAL